MKHQFTGQAEIAFKRIMKETNVWKSRLNLEGVKPSKEDERQWRRDRIYIIAILDAISGIVGRKATFRLETKIRFSQMRRSYKTQTGKVETPIRKLVMVERDYLTITINEEDFAVKSLHQKMGWLTRIIFEKLLYDESRKNDKSYNFNFNHFCGKCIDLAEVNYERYSRILNLIEKNEDKEDLLSSLGW